MSMESIESVVVCVITLSNMCVKQILHNRLLHTPHFLSSCQQLCLNTAKILWYWTMVHYQICLFKVQNNHPFKLLSLIYTSSPLWKELDTDFRKHSIKGTAYVWCMKDRANKGEWQLLLYLVSADSWTRLTTWLQLTGHLINCVYRPLMRVIASGH